MSVEIWQDGPVLTTRLCDGHRRNPLSRAVRAGLWDAITRVRKDKGIRVLVLEGEGPAFCAGGDLADMPHDHLAGMDFLTEVWDLFCALECLPVPVVSAVHGPATGGGFELCLASDFVVAGREKARFAIPEVKVGLVAAFAVCRLPQISGLRRARQAGMGGGFLSAEEALDWGIVTEVVDDADVHARTRALAQELAKGSPIAVALTKRIMNRELGGMEKYFGIDACAMLFANADTREGIDAFLNKREAKFIGREG
ncbi:enoyl-CoA hydratase/isomerase family protein [Nocardioides sp.]|uniref:enoyl-CoA hydratase/isomerase family protein n=1 Tax=Nocardioides sp. TaxID=35761 RepID=UPI0026318CB2|nr:enoyl-CoA hydratase/isomerase family protein [Nocardioides sp.]MDI6912485.1 enoyl-CoA hydratase/isomerase family protein [Nocardioides sp.]